MPLHDGRLMKSTDLRVRDVRTSFQDFRYRTPIKFGGVALDRVTLLNVECDIETEGGRRATGFGSMPLGNAWAIAGAASASAGRAANPPSKARRLVLFGVVIFGPLKVQGDRAGGVGSPSARSATVAAGTALGAAQAATVRSARSCSRATSTAT